MGPECWEKRIAFAFYCVPSTEQLTDFLSSGSEVMEKSWGAECTGGCRLAIQELSAPLARAGLQNH